MSPKTVPLRKLGKGGPSVPALGFGLMGMSFAYGTIPSDEDRFKVLDRAVELGATFWDSADLYGDSEELIGKWFKRTGKREQIFIATKFGFIKGMNPSAFDSSAAYCKEACEKSLEKLGIDYIDLYYLHRPNPDTPIEETMRALVELKVEGKIKHIGLSNVTSNTLRRAYKIAPVAAVQTEYSPFVLDIESASDTDLLATCRELGVAVVCYAPLGRGLLTTTFGSGEYGTDKADMRPAHLPRFMEKNRAANMKLVNQFKELAEKKGCTTAQLSLAWLLKQGDDIIPIPGTKTIKYLEENWEALNVHLIDDEELEIRKFVEGAEVAGGRAPASVTVLIDTKEES
ncbi:Aldo/keto reductase [Stipitochalara longipes BDJ]|nr:Aldo/keto reductase [Stipitochalara longipes BDJ]